MEEKSTQEQSFVVRQYREDHSSEKSSKPSRRILLPFFLIIFFIGGISYYFFGSKTTSKQPQETITPTEEQTQATPTETQIPTVTTSPTPEATESPTPQPTLNPVDKATGLDRSNLSVTVQNGSGKVGAASKMSDVLKTFGYHIISVGNADAFNYEDVTIQVKADKSKYLSLLKKDLTTAYAVGSTSATLSASASADAVVVVGK